MASGERRENRRWKIENGKKKKEEEVAVDSFQWTVSQRRDPRTKRRGIAPLDRKHPPFLHKPQKGWGTLKYVWGSSASAREEGQFGGWIGRTAGVVEERDGGGGGDCAGDGGGAPGDGVAIRI